MTSPATVTIHNRSPYDLVTDVTRDKWVESDGSTINDKRIDSGATQEFTISAKTGHHGELDIKLWQSSPRRHLATLYIKSIKDPQDGHGLEVTSELVDLQITAVGERSTPGAKDLRQIKVVLDDVSIASLPYNKVSMKASHNSYQRDETFIDQITWNTARPYDCGCGGLELDIAQSGDGRAWSVGHWLGYRGDFRQLSLFLDGLHQWATRHPGHDVVTLHLDLKHVASNAFPQQLDSYIRSHLPASLIYRPVDLMGTQPTLAQGADTNGWPKLSDLKGRFIICVTGDEGSKKHYAETDPRDRLCFADKDTKNDQEPVDAHRVFFNFKTSHGSRDQWMPIFKRHADDPKVITRAYDINSEDDWRDCLNSGCNVIATNKVSNHTWAVVGAQRFAKKVPLV